MSSNLTPPQRQLPASGRSGLGSGAWGRRHWASRPERTPWRSAPEVIAERGLDGVGPGAVILMHDAGGDRMETVDAPPPRDQSLEQLSGIATETEAPPQPIVP